MSLTVNVWTVDTQVQVYYLVEIFSFPHFLSKSLCRSIRSIPNINSTHFGANFIALISSDQPNVKYQIESSPIEFISVIVRLLCCKCENSNDWVDR